MRYSNLLRRYRSESYLNQKDVARRMGLKDGTLISRWETGFSLPDLENAFKLAAIYGVRVDALFFDLWKSVSHLDEGKEHIAVDKYEKNESATL
jgi:transcriptional regulator with XRE-family HTH domain